MVNNPTIRQLLEREPSGHPVLSLYLDMSVGPDNKRSHLLFLNKQRVALASSSLDRNLRALAAELLQRIERWLDAEYVERNRGVAIFAEIGGDYFRAVQLPRTVQNFMLVQDRPMVAPLAEALESERRWAILLVDRESMQLISVYLDQVEEEQAVAPEALPARHGVQAGGYSQKDHQKRKAEETRQFFKEFAEAAGRLHQRRRPEGYALLGTGENVKHFLEFLPQPVRDRVVHTGTVPTNLSASELVLHLAPVFRSVLERREAEAVQALLERVRNAHLAASGFHDTLVQLQEGKVDTLIISRDAGRDGVECTQCGFTMVRRDGNCPFCGGELRSGVDLVESMIRMAARQDARVEFVSGPPMDQVKGVGALLRF
jgi:peptide subunit release factor 1 (eRF1)